MSEYKFDPRASGFANNEFLIFTADSGYRSTRRDPIAPQQELSHMASNVEIGQAILDALSHSREIPEEEWALFFDLKRAQSQYEEWVNSLMQRYGYKTKRALFKGVKNCGIRRIDENIQFQPMKKTGVDAWEATARYEEDRVLVPVKSSTAEIGAAFRIALERCE